MTDDSVDDLIKSYADADRSDTFVSYNDAIVLAREVRRLRRQLVISQKLLTQSAIAFKINDSDIAAIIAAERAEHG